MGNQTSDNKKSTDTKAKSDSAKIKATLDKSKKPTTPNKTIVKSKEIGVKNKAMTAKTKSTNKGKGVATKSTKPKSTAKKNEKTVSRKKDLSKNSLRALGVKDVSSADYKFLSPIIKKLEETANNYSFSKIKTPILEDASLYKKFFDKNKSKMLFFLEARANEKLVLRPDLVHGLVRFFSESFGSNNLDKPQKFFSWGPVFRQEKVKSGIYRQFSQFNLSIINDPKPVTDAFMIFLVYNIFKELQIDVQVQINSLGSSEAQKEFLHKFSKFLKERGRRSKLCPECKKNMLKSLPALLECQEDECVKLRSEAPQIIDFLSEESHNRFYKTMEFLDELEINYNFNPFLTRDLGAYNELFFEIWPIEKNGEVNSKFALGRGGRYDSAFTRFDGKNISMLGFSGGLDRTLIKARENDFSINDDRPLIFLAQIDTYAKASSMKLFRELLSKGFNVKQAFHLDGLREQLEEARSFGAKIVLILGKKELSEETILFRDTDAGVQEIIARKDLIQRLEKGLEN